MVDDGSDKPGQALVRTAFIKISSGLSHTTVWCLRNTIDSGTEPHQREGVCTHPRPLSRSCLNTHARTDGYKRSSYYSLQRTQMQNVHKYAFMQMNIHVEIFPGYSGCNARCGIAIQKYTSWLCSKWNTIIWCFCMYRGRGLSGCFISLIV